MNSAEKQSGGSAESLKGSQEAAAERSRELAQTSPEKTSAKPELSAERARQDIEGLMHKEAPTPSEKPTESKQPALFTQKNRAMVYKNTLRKAQAQMNPTSRLFSKVIHAPGVEKVSDAFSKTIARPNAIMAGSLCALLLVGAVYLLAKNLGYPLSGFETIAAFIIGWIIGLVYDFVRVMITGKTS